MGGYQCFEKGKQRARIALQDSNRKSFGIREEHRISWDLFLGLKDVMGQDLGDLGDLGDVLDCPSYVKTRVYLDYLWRNADKFATGFELIQAKCQDLVTWKQTKMMAMFLRSLRFVFGGHQLSRGSTLWWSKRKMVGNLPQKIWYGLGFCNTLTRYG